MSDAYVFLGFFSGVGSGLLAALVAAYFQNKSAKENLKFQLDQERDNLKIQLVQEEKNLKIQLLYDDRKKALRELYQVIDMKYDSYRKFEKAVEGFLNGVSGDLIPSKIAGDVRSELHELSEKLKSIEPPEPSDEEVEHWIEDYQEFLGSMPPEERVQYEVDNMAESFKSRIKKVIREDMKEV